MGWSHSAFLAQAAHEHVIDSCTSLKSVDRITRSSDYRLDRVRHFTYIDDFGALGLERHRSEMDGIQTEYGDAMEGKGLPPKASKHVAPSSDGAECIGVEVHGTKLTSGVHPAKIAKLVRRTRVYLARDIPRVSTCPSSAGTGRGC